jgi:hypothetical protein
MSNIPSQQQDTQQDPDYENETLEEFLERYYRETGMNLGVITHNPENIEILKNIIKQKETTMSQNNLTQEEKRGMEALLKQKLTLTEGKKNEIFTDLKNDLEEMKDTEHNKSKLYIIVFLSNKINDAIQIEGLKKVLDKKGMNNKLPLYNSFIYSSVKALYEEFIRRYPTYAAYQGGRMRRKMRTKKMRHGGRRVTLRKRKRGKGKRGRRISKRIVNNL